MGLFCCSFVVGEKILSKSCVFLCFVVVFFFAVAFWCVCFCWCFIDLFFLCVDRGVDIILYYVSCQSSRKKKTSKNANLDTTRKAHLKKGGRKKRSESEDKHHMGVEPKIGLFPPKMDGL